MRRGRKEGTCSSTGGEKEGSLAPGKSQRLALSFLLDRKGAEFGGSSSQRIQVRGGGEEELKIKKTSRGFEGVKRRKRVGTSKREYS